MEVVKQSLRRNDDRGVSLARTNIAHSPMTILATDEHSNRSSDAKGREGEQLVDTILGNPIYRKHFYDIDRHYIPGNTYSHPYAHLVHTQITTTNTLKAHLCTSTPFYTCNHHSNTATAHFLKWTGDDILGRNSKLTYTRMKEWKRQRAADKWVGERVSEVFKALAAFKAKIK